MFEWTKRHFIPTRENGYQPHFLRLRAALGIFLLVIVLEGTYLLATTVILPRSSQFAAIFASVLIDQTNEQRRSDSLSTLHVNAKLETAARMKAQDMAAKGYFAHNAPDGKTPWYWFDQAGYDYAAAGENLAVNFTDSKDVTEAWMRSPGHRANIMSGNYTEIGIATVEGTYKGKAAIFVVQEFGRPSIVARQLEEASSTIASLSAMISGNRAEPAKIAQKTPAPIVARPTMAPSMSSIVATAPAAPTSTPIVAGAETAKLDTGDAVISVTAPQEVVQSSAAAQMLASPRNMTTTIYLILGAILSLVLGLAIFIKIRVQHPHILANGILLIAILCSVSMLNAVLTATKGAI